MGRHLEACEGTVSGRDGAGSDELRDTLGLGEVEAAVEERPEGEFARGGEAAACSEAQVQHALRGHAAAVAVQLDDVLARVRAWAQHWEEEDLVHDVARGLDDVTIVDAMGGRLEVRRSLRRAAGRSRTEDMGTEGNGIGPREPDDGD